MFYAFSMSKELLAHIEELEERAQCWLAAAPLELEEIAASLGDGRMNVIYEQVPAEIAGTQALFAFQQEVRSRGLVLRLLLGRDLRSSLLVFMKA